MADTTILAVGVFTFLLLSGGLAFTIYEVPRLYRKKQPEAVITPRE